MGLFMHFLTSQELICYGLIPPIAAKKLKMLINKNLIETRIDRENFIVYNNEQVMEVATNRNGCRNAAGSAALCSKYPNYIIYIIN